MEIKICDGDGNPVGLISRETASSVYKLTVAQLASLDAGRTVDVSYRVAGKRVARKAKVAKRKSQ